MSDWQNRTKAYQRDTLAGLRDLAGPKPEEAEQRAFLALARHRPWGNRVEAAVPENRGAGLEGTKRGRRAKRAGQVPGVPDLRVWLPGRLVAFCELKAPGERPKRSVPAYWWLEWARQLTPEWETRGPFTRYGLTGHQALYLLARHQDGHATLVAYDAAAAVEWVDGLWEARQEGGR